MRNLTELSLKNKTLVWYFIVVIALAGVFSYMKLGRMEDPAYTVRKMVVTVAWPGATAQQMEEQVTDKLEKSFKTLRILTIFEAILNRGVPLYSLIWTIK